MPLDDLRRARILAREPGQRFVDDQQFLGALVRRRLGRVEIRVHIAPAALVGEAPARLVDEDLAHRAGGEAEEVRRLASTPAFAASLA